MSSGFPTRPDRDSFGPTMLDVVPVRDPERHVGAGLLNLFSHQVAGLGLISPRVMMRLTVNGGSSAIVARAEAWNPKGLATGDKVAPTLSSPGTGLLAVTYPTSITDQEGNAVGIGFQWGMGMIADSPPSTLRHVQVAVTAGTPSEFVVGVFDNAGTLIDGQTVTVLVW